MYMIDSSAWIEFLRKTGSPANDLVRRLVMTDQPIATTEPVAMELLAGAVSQSELIKLEKLVDGLHLLAVDATTDYRHAARLYRTARGRGYTVRKMIDCLIATVALRNGAVVVHRDQDFNLLHQAFPDLRVQSAF